MAFPTSGRASNARPTLRAARSPMPTEWRARMRDPGDAEAHARVSRSLSAAAAGTLKEA